MISLRYIPDAPLNICRDPLLSTTTQISILWDDGLYDGNSPVLDYRVSFDQAIGVWAYLITGLTTRNFVTDPL